LASITLRHRRSNDPDKTDERTWRNLDQGQSSPADLKINYETGIGADGDYWWVSFQLDNGNVYRSKSSFYCDLTADDENGIVTAIVDGQYNRLTIDCPVSSDCKTDSIAQERAVE
jgi:hypothetical protein